ncbi:hypothetical protein FIBSPDRAFT_947960 [Athelia psychrophila]|uniref:Uncharacterized protein n=1 Tax=Athelia psychrophila TaxID=1759441 RepID=A0A166R9V0_9AGAM|nr:hypothetical protein FIBSPDRAFT_947960 [Fibularhizoctonia sp. CBS 109695]
MPGDEQSSSSKHWYQEDSTRIILATFATLAVAAGSHIWRRSHSPMASSSPPKSPNPEPQDGIARTTVDTSAADTGEQSAASKAAKNSRSKDRRRRGKDPVKLLPAGVAATTAKKDKGKKKGAQGGSSSVVIPQIIEPAATSHDESRSQSTASPSTSRSSSACAPRNPNLLNVAEPGEDEPEDTDDVQTPVVPALGASKSEPVIYDTPFQGHALSTSQTEPSFAVSALTPALVSSASSSSSSTMPATPKSDSAQLLSQTLPPSISMYPHYAPASPSRSPNRRMSPAPNGSWDYDNHHLPGPDPATTYRKPPRFRSKSRGSAGSGLGTGLEMPAPMALPASASYPPAPYGAAPLLVPSDFAALSEGAGGEPAELLPTFTFPSLNNPSPAAEFELRPPPVSASRPGSAASMRARAGPNANLHRASSSSLANSPLRTPTPSQMHPQSPLASSFAASPSSSTTVSAQTQLASLRGALEAARLREEKGKQEVERLHRECADLRWRWSEDAGRWSRREMELQNYVQMLTRQLHAYASVVAADPQLQMSPPAGYAPGAMLPPVPTGIPPSVYAAASAHSHSQPPSPGRAPDAQLPSQPSQPLSRPPTQPQSPTSRSHPGSPQVPGSILGPLSPFTQQAFPLAHFPHQHPLVPRGQEAPFQAPHPNGYAGHSSAFSLFYPGAGSGSGYSSPSASPVIVGRGIEGDGSPLGDRGRRRGRARTHTASQLERHDGEGSGSGSGNSNGNGNSNGGRDVFGADGEEEEEEINGVLADAILKRPESIRNGSFGSLRKKASGGEQRKGAVSLNEERGAAGHPKEEDGWVRPPDAPAVAVA